MSVFCDDIGKSQRIPLNKLRIFPSYSARPVPVTFGSLEGIRKECICDTSFRLLSSHEVVHLQEVPASLNNYQEA